MGLFKTIKVLAFKTLGFTAFDPLNNDFPHLPPGKYGKYVCQICKNNQATRWHEETRVMFCMICALKTKDWI